MIKQSELKQLTNLYFDGKRGPILQKNCKTVVGELISVITEPGAKFVTHFEPKSGSGLHIAQEIDNVLIEYDSQDSLLALGMDGCPVNCAPHKGVARKVELTLGRPLQWLVCLLQ